MSDRNKTDCAIVLTTVDSQEKGKEIAEALLQEKLAACINIFPVQSLYSWGGKVNCDPEFQLIIKTHHSLIEKLTTKIQSLHYYGLPEVLVLPIIDGSTAYLQWLKDTISIET